MNKQKIDQLIPRAYEELNKSGIAINGEINCGYHGQIAAFDASVAMGTRANTIYARHSRELVTSV